MPRRKIYDEDLRKRLISRGAELLAESGVTGLGLREVAAAEGTSTTAIYSMFEDRAGLIREVGRTASLGFVAAQRAVPVTDDPYADLFRLGRSYRNWALAHPTLYLVLMSPQDRSMPLEAPLQEAEAADPLRELIVRLIDAKIFVAMDPDMMLGIIWAAVHGFVALELAGYYDPTPKEQRDLMYGAQLDSIGRGWRTVA
jgi:AcrR family transcriptional regulator